MIQSFNTFWHNDLFYFFFVVLISKDRTTVYVCLYLVWEQLHDRSRRYMAKDVEAL